MAITSGNFYLNQSQMEGNVDYIYPVLIAKGWTNLAIGALLGNMQRESSINPGIWQGLIISEERGYGLTQWTPSTKITSWLSSHGYAGDSMDGELAKLQEEVDTDTTSPNQGQWIKTSSYPISFQEFTQASTTINTLDWYTAAFMYNYERPGDPALELRIQYAHAWYDYISNITPPQPTPERKKMPLWLYMRPRY